MLARKAVASHGIRQWPPRRMDIPANREDPACIDCCWWCVAVDGAWAWTRPAWRNQPPRFLARSFFRWPFSLDLRHFRRIIGAV